MNAVTSLLYVPNVVATKADGADKGSKFVKTCLAVFKEMCASSAVLFPLPLTNLNVAIGQLNSVNTLIQVPFRYGEWEANKWGINKEANWAGQSNGFYSKALLTAGLLVESARILQANYVLPVTENLFSVLGKVPVFQTASRVINSFPAGSFLSNLALKVSGLEMIKNLLFISSSVFALNKACDDYDLAQGRLEKALVDWDRAQGTIDYATEYVEDFDQQRQGLDRAIQSVADQKFARLDIEKSNRACWKEVTKLTVLGTASLIVLGFITSPVLLTMFNTVTVATAAFNLWCVVKDEQAVEARAKIAEKLRADLNPARERPLPVDEDDTEEVGTDNDGASSNGAIQVDLDLIYGTDN